MRKRVLFLVCLAFAIPIRSASADPVRITSGAFNFDIEGDFYNLNGEGFSLATTGIGIYANKVLPGQCGSVQTLPFCPQAEGSVVDWSLHTVGGEQLLGRGNVTVDGVNATGVDFVGSVQFDATPTALNSGGTLDFDFVAPFSFAATIRGLQGGQELFSRRRPAA